MVLLCVVLFDIRDRDIPSEPKVLFGYDGRYNLGEPTCPFHFRLLSPTVESPKILLSTVSVLCDLIEKGAQGRQSSQVVYRKPGQEHLQPSSDKIPRSHEKLSYPIRRAEDVFPQVA